MAEDEFRTSLLSFKQQKSSFTDTLRSYITPQSSQSDLGSSSIASRAQASIISLALIGIAVLIGTFALLWGLPLLVIRPSKFVLLYTLVLVLLYMSYLYRIVAYQGHSLAGSFVHSLYADGKVQVKVVANVVLMLLMVYAALLVQSQLLCLGLILAQIGYLVYGAKSTLLSMGRYIPTPRLPI